MMRNRKWLMRRKGMRMTKMMHMCDSLICLQGWMVDSWSAMHCCCPDAVCQRGQPARQGQMIKRMRKLRKKMAMMYNFLGTVMLFSHSSDFNVFMSILFVSYLCLQTVICDSIFLNHDCIVQVSTSILLVLHLE